MFCWIKLSRHPASRLGTHHHNQTRHPTNTFHQQLFRGQYSVRRKDGDHECSILGRLLEDDLAEILQAAQTPSLSGGAYHAKPPGT